MRQDQINFRVESEIKKKFANVCKNMGMTSAEALRIIMQQTIKEEALPISFKLNHETIKTIKEANQGINVKSFNNVDELFEDLNSDN